MEHATVMDTEGLLFWEAGYEGRLGFSRRSTCSIGGLPA